MKERPIIFSGPMVRALLAGTKTKTRRICKPAATLSAVIAVQDPDEQPFGQRPPYLTPGWFGDEDGELQFFSPYGAPGDRLWVRETWAHDAETLEQCRAAHEDVMGGLPYGPYYRATECAPDTLHWRPSIHMPRWASRITLEVTGVRVERLLDISEEDAIAEGVSVPRDHRFAPVNAYMELWASIHGYESWDANPWVWVVEFKKV